MIYVLRSVPSDSARELATALRGRRIRRTRAFQPRDVLVCWGTPAVARCRVLNGAPLRNKIGDASALLAAGISTITTRVGPAPADGTEWIPRMRYHIGGDDLLTPPRRPDFYVRREDLAREYRVHSFRGQSIRAGIKVPRDGFAPGNPVASRLHPWVRSWDGGWRIAYRGVRQRVRTIAHQAVAALGLDFGAVDIGERADGTLIILEVNRAPGIELGTTDAYANAIQRWIQQGA